ncbi:histidine kinase [Paraburkholderia sp. LEh10]|uniref:sensor histidine kinase n=1 Tax=Paraburkholderia sp. LEh10 TaxID=2821353 RepID=UPI001AE22F4F|nr:ATP-binding protein [Paraburkholderia sp. LEh10]MBP0588587.1 histidine kinase [Paraburkholderia sp. LEh10]
MNIERVSFLGKQNPKLTLALAGALAVFVFWVETFGHFATAVMVLYSIVVMLAATVFSRRGTLIVAAACIAATIAGFLIGHLHHDSYSAVARSAVACFAIVAATALTLRIQADGARLAEQVRELNRTHEALNRSTAELAHATRVTMLGELAASIAHEVTQPLAAITAHGDAGLRWLRRDTPNLDEACHAFEAMVSNARRSSEIIRRIRALARKGEPAFAPLGINNVVVETIDLLEPEVMKYGAVVKMNLAPGELMVNGDRVQLQQVLINLAVNGLQAMSSIHDRPRELSVHTRIEHGLRAVVTVEDSGEGVAPDVAARLFGAFFTTKADGMGLGLSICRSIVEGHGGSISCEMPSARGARMQIELPIAMHANA